MNILTNYDFNKNQILNVSLQKLATDPASPFLGQVYFNTNAKRAKYYNGTEWIPMDGLGATMTGQDIIAAINGTSNKINQANVNIGVFTAANDGLVPKTTTGNTTDYLRRDGTWATPPDTNTTYSVFTRSAGGLVPVAPAGGGTTKYLREDGNWIIPPDTVYTNFTRLVAGLVPAAPSGAGTTKYLREDGSWEVPPDTIYSHPATDGNLHVPATGTSNNGKILTAGSSAGSISWTTNAPDWANVSNKPTSTVANIDDAVNKRHGQNTDTGTSSNVFAIGTSGVKIKNSGGTELQVRNNADNDYADLRIRNLVVEGATTTLNSNTVNIGDNEIELNSDITASVQNSDGGIAIKRLMADNTTRKDARLTFNNGTGKWDTTFGAVAGTLITAQLANKVVATVGDGSTTSYTITHNLNTRDLSISIRESAAPYALVITDVEMTTLDAIAVKFAIAPTVGQYTVTIIG